METTKKVKEGVKKVAVMRYDTCEIDIVTFDKEIDADSIEEHLNYHLSEIYWMEFDKGKINYLTSEVSED